MALTITVPEWMNGGEKTVPPKKEPKTLEDRMEAIEGVLLAIQEALSVINDNQINLLAEVSVQVESVEEKVAQLAIDLRKGQSKTEWDLRSLKD